MAILAAPLDALSTLAGVAAAISIAYAGLPKFRYKESVQQYVRRLIDKAFIESLLTNRKQGGAICEHPTWTMLHRLGNLGGYKMDGGLDIPQPTGRCPDRGFHDSDDGISYIGYSIYNRLFSNSVDRVVAIILGGFAISVIWFSAMDRWHFATPEIGDIGRVTFLSGILYWYMFIGGVSTLYIGLRVAQTEGSLLFLHIVLAIAYFITFFFACTIHPLFTNYFGTVTEDTVFFVISLSLFLSIAIPLLLLSLGGHLSKEAENKAKECKEVLVGLVAQSAGSATEPSGTVQPRDPRVRGT